MDNRRGFLVSTVNENIAGFAECLTQAFSANHVYRCSLVEVLAHHSNNVHRRGHDVLRLGFEAQFLELFGNSERSTRSIVRYETDLQAGFARFFSGRSCVFDRKLARVGSTVKIQKSRVKVRVERSLRAFQR